MPCLSSYSLIFRAIMHPKFVASLYEQDIALLHLDEDLVFSSSVLPVCLPPPGAGRTAKPTQCIFFFNWHLSTDTGRFPYLGRLATLTGWGRLWDKGPLADGWVLETAMCWCDQPETNLAASHDLHFTPTHVAGWRWYSCPWFPMTSAWSGTTGILSES